MSEASIEHCDKCDQPVYACQCTGEQPQPRRMTEEQGQAMAEEARAMDPRIFACMFEFEKLAAILERGGFGYTQFMHLASDAWVSVVGMPDELKDLA